MAHIEAHIDEVKVGTILVHVPHDRHYWFSGRTVVVTNIDKEHIHYRTIGDDRGLPDYDGSKFVIAGLKDFEVSRETRDRPTMQNALTKFVRLQHLMDEVDELKRELRLMLD